MTERGQSPPDATHNKKSSGKGGYVRSTHMEGDVGPTSKHAGERGGNPHTGIFKTAEHKSHGSAHKLPMEKHVPFRKGIAAGDHFEGEIKEHFPNSKGIAGIHKTSMPHSKEVTPHESVSHDHGSPSGKAEHHPGMKKTTGPIVQHALVDHPQGSHAHGFGHGPDQRHGVFRLSGHKGAHRIGSRSSRCK